MCKLDPDAAARTVSLAPRMVKDSSLHSGPSCGGSIVCMDTWIPVVLNSVHRGAVPDVALVPVLKTKQKPVWKDELKSKEEEELDRKSATVSSCRIE